jgi:cyclopropane-fatty-acyl-phospholipid synthase
MILPLRLGKKNRSPDGAQQPTPDSPGKLSALLAEAAARDDAAARLTLEILEKITDGTPLRRVSVRLWNGAIWPNAEPRAATLVLNHPGSLREMLSGGSEVALGEAYLHEVFDVEGDIEAAFEMGDLLAARTRGWTHTLSIVHLLHRLPAIADHEKTARHRAAQFKGTKNSPDRDRKAIRFHYDISNAFYALWLDPAMVYSCAYFQDAETGLEQAQFRKLDLICRKLRLQPGERLLDIGSGWGGLLVHAAMHYGVKAEGITLSERQLEWCRRLIEEKGLADRVSVRLIDYRDLKETGAYDKIVSVGMVEHVGRKNLPAYFEKAFALLKTGGLFLNHGIGLGPVLRQNEGESFIDRYVFPDSDLVSIGQMLGAAESAGWEVRDVDSLREHYAMTLRHWVRRLESRHADALKEIDEAAYRIWRLYMAGSAHGFQVGYLSIYQSLLAKIDGRGFSSAPLTREEWYREKASA